MNDKQHNPHIRATLRVDDKCEIVGVVIGSGGRAGSDEPSIQISIPAQVIWVHSGQWRLETQEWRPYGKGSK